MRTLISTLLANLLALVCPELPVIQQADLHQLIFAACKTTSTTTSTTTTTLFGVAPTDWGSSMVAWWNLDDAANGDRVKTAGSCSNCTLTDGTQDVAQESSEAMEPFGAPLGAFFQNDYLSCSLATCTGMALSANADMAFGCWVKTDTDGGNILSWIDGSWNVVLSYSTGSELFNCALDWSTYAANTPSSTYYPAGTIAHVACTYDNDSGTPGTLTAFANGYAGTAHTTAAQHAMSSGTFYVGNTDWNDFADECFFDNNSWTAAEVCRVAHCGIQGKGCTCDATTPANYKSCSVDGDCRNGGTHNVAKCVNSTCSGRDLSGTDCTLSGPCNADAPAG